MTEQKTIILTGASGMIGKETIPFLVDAGFDIYALTRDASMSRQQGINWVHCDILDRQQVKKVFKLLRPKYLLHLAWDMKGHYLFSPKNDDYKNASLNMLLYFKRYGGTRAVFAGSCFEYELKDSALKETDTTVSIVPYTKAKNTLYQQASKYAKKKNISFAWGRVFYVYGHGGNKSRFITQLLRALKIGRKIQLDNGYLQRDFIYSKDAALAFVKLLQSEVEGAVNICSGIAFPIGQYAKTLARLLKCEKSLRVKNIPAPEVPEIVLGNNTRLKKEVGFKNRYTLNTGLKDLITTFSPYNL